MKLPLSSSFRTTDEETQARASPVTAILRARAVSHGKNEDNE